MRISNGVEWVNGDGHGRRSAGSFGAVWFLVDREFKSQHTDVYR